MTAKYKECPTCKQYGVATTTCDGCGKVIADGEPRWEINARYADEGDDQSHACSNNCLERALEHAGWKDEESTKRLVCLSWEGSPSDVFVLVRQVSSQSKA